MAIPLPQKTARIRFVFTNPSWQKVGAVFSFVCMGGIGLNILRRRRSL